MKSHTYTLSIKNVSRKTDRKSKKKKKITSHKKITRTVWSQSV